MVSNYCVNVIMQMITNFVSKLINKSVAGTVDLRALSKVSGSATQRAEALQDNMTLVVESARAIGCRIHDATIDNILHKEPEAINDFLLDLVRVGYSMRMASWTPNAPVLYFPLGSCSAHAWHGR